MKTTRELLKEIPYFGMTATAEAIRQNPSTLENQANTIAEALITAFSFDKSFFLEKEVWVDVYNYIVEIEKLAEKQRIEHPDTFREAFRMIRVAKQKSA